ncbi:cysteine--tRNA ligase [Devosia sp. CAU 1758]
MDRGSPPEHTIVWPTGRPMTTAKPQLSLYNTLTRSKAPFVPMDASNVRLYACGPTVYDFAHIGNGRAAIVFDLLFRVLRHTYGADHVTYVRNITDVDDKINARALRDFPDLPLNQAIRKVTETTAAQYQKDVAALGCLEPTIQPRATENIGEMQAMIQRLLDKGNAYEADGEVLFAVDSMPDYGQLSGRNLEDNLAGARIAIDTHKRNPADFVLWKLSSPDEPGWDSPWGRGRPGWHIECSAMSERYLGETFDIHGGGLDLIFPHHENEIAQSRCAHGSHAMANVWMHNGFLQVEGQKMSKSLGNFFTIHDLLETDAFGGRKWPGEVLRLAMLMTHYRQPIDFGIKRLEEAYSIGVSLRRIAEQHVASVDAKPSDEIVTFLAEDLNTPAAIQHLQSAASSVRNGTMDLDTFLASANLLGILMPGFFLVDDAWTDSTKMAVLEHQIAARLAALNAKDFAKADAIRNELTEQGIALMDYKDETGARQTKWEVKR